MICLREFIFPQLPPDRSHRWAETCCWSCGTWCCSGAVRAAAWLLPAPCTDPWTHDSRPSWTRNGLPNSRMRSFFDGDDWWSMKIMAMAMRMRWRWRWRWRCKSRDVDDDGCVHGAMRCDVKWFLRVRLPRPRPQLRRCVVVAVGVVRRALGAEF